jgi:hypothetical protein
MHVLIIFNNDPNWLVWKQVITDVKAGRSNPGELVVEANDWYERQHILLVCAMREKPLLLEGIPCRRMVPR